MNPVGRRRLRDWWLPLATQYSALLLLIVLPLDSSFRARARLMYLTPWELVQDSCLLVLLYAACALLLALVLAVPATALDRWRPVAAQRWIAAAQALGWLITLLLLQPLAQAWWQKTQTRLGIAVPALLRYGFALTLLALLALSLWRRGFVQLMASLSLRLQGARTLLLVLVGGSLLLVLASGHLAVRGLGWQSTPGALPPASGPLPPNVVLIVIDALAAGDTSVYGYPLDTTPALRRFAERAWVFDNFFSASNFTTSSMASVLTGRHVLNHGVQQIDGRLAPADRRNTLHAELHSGGYTTGAIVSNPMAHPLNLAASEGFDYLSHILQRLPGGWVLDSMQLEHAKLMPVLRDVWWWPWLMRHSRQSRDPRTQLESPYPPGWVQDDTLQFVARAHAPWFAWAHFMPPHDPYLADAPFRRRFLDSQELLTWAQQHAEPAFAGPYDVATQQARVDLLRRRYDESVAFVDHHVGQLLDALERAGRFADSIVIVTADHGESFDHGFQMHAGPLLYDSLVKVPLLIHLPGQVNGARVTDYAGQVDLLPTILELAGRAVPAWAEGRSLAPLFKGQVLPERAQISMNLEFSSRYAPLRLGSFALEARPYKLIRYEGWDCEELYDRDRDPAESVELSGAQPQQAARLRQELARRLHLDFVPPTRVGAGCRPRRGGGATGRKAP